MRFLYNCKQAHQMVSEGLDRQLTFSERLQLKLHLSMCHSCSNFNGQMLTLHRAMRQLPANTSEPRKDQEK
jgi:predicted anti-sigma-YlaC factor YlaD